MSETDTTTQGDPRELRGLQLAAMAKITQKGADWIVPSQSGHGTYRVNLEAQSCDCPDHEAGHTRCKHVIAAEIVYQREMFSDGTVTETRSVTVTYAPERPTYPQPWREYNLAQQNEKAQFAVLLRDLCGTLEQPQQTNGRPRLPISDMAFAATFKVYSGFSSRRFTTDLREMQYRGLIDHAPHFNSVSNYLSDPGMTPVLKSLIEQSAAPLSAVEVDFAIDSSGFATNTYSRWYDHKWGKERTRQTWVKAHLMCGTRTNIVTAVEATPTESGDSPQLPMLLDKTAQTFNVREVSADKAYASRVNHYAIAVAGAEAFIPFQERYSGAASHQRAANKVMDSVWNKAWHFYNFNRPHFLAHYHKRSNVESTMAMIKSKFGGSVKSKSPEGQVNEVLCKVLCHNIAVLVHSFYELGIESHFCTKSPPSAQELLA